MWRHCCPSLWYVAEYFLRIYIYIYIYIYTCIYIYMHTYTYTYTYIHTYIHIYIHTYTCMHACMHAYIQSHTHTYIIHTYIHTYVYIHICQANNISRCPRQRTGSGVRHQSGLATPHRWALGVWCWGKFIPSELSNAPRTLYSIISSLMGSWSLMLR